MKKNLPVKMRNQFFHGLATVLVFSVGIMYSFSQITITQSDVASIGDTILVARDTTPTLSSVGGTGQQTWDFTSLQMDVVVENAFVSPSATFAGASFPSSNLAIDVNSGSQVNYLSVNSGSFEINGFWGDPLGMGSPVTVLFNPSTTVMQFPAGNNDSFQSYLRFENYFAVPANPFQIDSGKIIRNSHVFRTIDAYGLLITPADSFDCLRQFSFDTIIDSLFIYSGGQWAQMPDLFLPMLPPELGYTSNPDTSFTYTYSWYANNEGMAVAEVTTDSQGGNVLSASFKITDKVIAGPLTYTDISCHGVCTGSATATAISGYSPYVYLWDASAGSQTTAFADSLCAGTYSVTITDNMGYQSSSSVTISEPELLLDSTTSLSAQCSTCSDGTASVYGIGGTAPYFFSWSSGQSTGSITNIIPGTYYVTITDFNSCSRVDSVVVGFWAVGVSEQPVAGNRLTVFPNPSSGKIFVAAGNNDIKSVTVYNVLGEIVFIERNSTAKLEVDLSKADSGIYFMKIEGQNFTETKRINLLR